MPIEVSDLDDDAPVRVQLEVQLPVVVPQLVRPSGGTIDVSQQVCRRLCGEVGDRRAKGGSADSRAHLVR
jgi:hypothetical protein